MGDTLFVNFAALHQASADITAALGALHSQLGQLERDAAPLVQTWSGDAKQAYEARQSRWRAAATDLATMLRDIKVAVDDSVADYQNTERRNTGLFR
ncbi:WXG100 family type VII secretion target [Rhizomonospora bruguierae]|uniref:WXG100 family type VII secretion target n=1 Tax=Rhizomonospora bruguierae TaxID=1581705 RepID=UPI001BCEB499|nr:WXG100 family type VII secretion target [Micromonospora sp. NBRC 107566]